MSQNGEEAAIEILEFARKTLQSSGFVTESTEVGGREALLAENPYCLLALVVTPTTAELLAMEPSIVNLVRTKARGMDLGAKQWDLYVVLLSSSNPAAESSDLDRIFGLNYDTHRFRRIARVGVKATSQAVRQALSPFLEPMRLDNSRLSMDPLAALTDALVNRGIAPGTASQAIESYREERRIDGIF